jgi:hypothetical protein
VKALKIPASDLQTLWARGGFLSSFLAAGDKNVQLTFLNAESPEAMPRGRGVFRVIGQKAPVELFEPRTGCPK